MSHTPLDPCILHYARAMATPGVRFGEHEHLMVAVDFFTWLGALTHTSPARWELEIVRFNPAEYAGTELFLDVVMTIPPALRDEVKWQHELGFFRLPTGLISRALGGVHVLLKLSDDSSGTVWQYHYHPGS